MNVIEDLSYAARSLRKTPGLVAVVVLTLALGIGVNTTLFNLLNSMVLAPPTALAPDRLVRIEPGNGNRISYRNFLDMGSSPAFVGMALSSGTTLNWRRGDVVEQVPAMSLSANFFALAGTPAWLGRTFSAEEAAPERNPAVVVLSYDFWKRRFDADRGVIGRTIDLNGRPFTIIGVMGHGYNVVMGAMNTQMFVPIGPAVSPGLEDRRSFGFSVVARLAPGVGRAQAGAAFTAMARPIEAAYPNENTSFGNPAFVVPVYGLGGLENRQSHPEFFIGLAAPFVVVGLLLLIACANVAGVMLARGAMRQREIAIRLALGASRARVVRMLLADSLLLSALGTAGGLLLTAWISPLIAQIRIPNTPTLPPFELQMDPRMALYTLAVVVATSVFCGLIPARQSTSPQILAWLKRTNLQGSSGGGMRRLLVGGQVAASALLLVVCLLFLRSLLYIGSVDPGFDIDHGITAKVAPEQKSFTPEQSHAVAEELARRMQALPGVQSASFASLVPLGGDSVGGDVLLQDRPDFRGPMIQFSNVGPGYFRTMRIEVRRGREFQPSDRKGAPAVAIVNQSFARLLFPNGDALGKLVRPQTANPEPWREIVGVVADNKYAFYSEAPSPQLFTPFLQTGGRIFLQARTAGAPAGSIEAVRRTIAEFDKSLVADVRTTRDATSLEFALRRLSTALLAAMGVLGLVLSMIGLYGVLSWEVSRRTAEIGIRMALGASPRRVRRLVFRNALAPVGLGAGCGIGAAMLVTLPMHSFLAGVTHSDPLTIGSVTVLLMLVSLAASWFPVRRATRIDPMAALRNE
ncbi:MAG TPA: ABC transporter permease [Bryobacteraceae bacterium]|jgi:predicted permease|nr:ABC transporter permease [Bryobacteraceae bacterium]